MSPTWEQAKEAAAAVILEGGAWSPPGGTGVDCTEAVRRALAACGASVPWDPLWLMGGWQGGTEAALERVEGIVASGLWERVAGELDELPDSVEPLDVILTREPIGPLHVSTVVTPRGTKLLTSMRDAGVMVVPKRMLGRIVGIYRYIGGWG